MPYVMRKKGSNMSAHEVMEFVTKKIKSFADLPVLLHEHLYKDSTCEHCASVESIDLFLTNIPHFFTIGTSSSSPGGVKFKSGMVTSSSSPGGLKFKSGIVMLAETRRSCR